MATFTLRKNGRQSKPLKASQIFTLLKKGQIDESDDVLVAMTVGEFTKSSFARQQALDESIKDRTSRLEQAKLRYAEMKTMVAEARNSHRCNPIVGVPTRRGSKRGSAIEGVKGSVPAGT